MFKFFISGTEATGSRVFIVIDMTMKMKVKVKLRSRDLYPLNQKTILIIMEVQPWARWLCIVIETSWGVILNNLIVVRQ